MSGDDWEWDDTLYAGSAAHYRQGRMPYPADLVDALRDELGLDRTGRLLDVGCGPGSLTLPLAGWFAAALGVDADADMLTEAQAEARRRGVTNVRWLCRRAEELRAEELGRFRVVTFAQSFHWMQRSWVAALAAQLVGRTGTVVHVGATTHQGVDDDEPRPAPRPPWSEIDALVAEYLGPTRRAGRGARPAGAPGEDDAAFRAVGLGGPRRLSVGGGTLVERDEDDVVAAVHSLSSATPHLLGDRLERFDADLRRLLRRTSPEGRFCERTQAIGLSLWRSGC